MEHFPELTCKKFMLTHMSDEVLSCANQVELPVAEDGLQVTL